MDILNCLNDDRINAKNYLVEMSLKEYLDLSREIIKNNALQRRKVSSSSTIYSLLKDDFRRGCVIPPIVLSLGLENSNFGVSGESSTSALKDNVDSLVILDGLQRTYTLLDLVEDMSLSSEADLEQVLNRRIRVEIYVGLNRLGILYRMLTLNTGQTPMSLRQQIEMLYLDLSRHQIGGVKLVREIDDIAPSNLGEYSFRSMVEGFNAYIERNELPIDRFDLLESIKTLERLSHEDVKSDLFPDFVATYHSFIERLQIATNDHQYVSNTPETTMQFDFNLSTELDIKGQPFGRSVRRIFSKSQAMTGFGAAIGKLRDRGDISSFLDVSQAIEKLQLNNAIIDITALLNRLEQIRLSSKKIGNSQRLYFHFFFRQLFDPNADAYLNLGVAVETAYRRYETEMM